MAIALLVIALTLRVINSVAQVYVCFQQFDGDDAFLTFAGSDAGSITANLRDEHSWVRTVTDMRFTFVAGGAQHIYHVDLQSSPLPVPCTAPPMRSSFTCLVEDDAGYTLFSFTGPSDGSPILRSRTDGWLASLSENETSYVTQQRHHSHPSDYYVVLHANQVVVCQSKSSTTGISLQTDVCEISDIMEVCEGALLGSTGDFSAKNESLPSRIESFLETERKVGRKYDLFHDFLRPDQWGRIAQDGFPYSRELGQLVNGGRLLFINWKNPGGPLEWKNIAMGSQDSVVDTTAKAFAKFGQSVFLTFHHEPEDSISELGDEQIQLNLCRDYSAAFRHIKNRFLNMGASNVIWVWNVQGYSRWFSYYENGLYPGDDVVDWVSFNRYNWFGCNSNRWSGFEEILAGPMNWLDSNDGPRPARSKPVMIGEFSTEENRGADNSDETKGDWFRSIPFILQERFPRVKAMVVFDTEGRDDKGIPKFCFWSISSSLDSLSGFTEMAANNFFNKWHGGNKEHTTSIVRSGIARNRNIVPRLRVLVILLFAMILAFY